MFFDFLLEVMERPDSTDAFARTFAAEPFPQESPSCRRWQALYPLFVVDRRRGALLHPPMRIAFVGTGVMGVSMAGHLLRAGHELLVHTRTRAKAEPLLAAGARWAASAAEAEIGRAHV